MLPARARMRHRADFSAAVRGGHRSVAPALVVHYRAADDSAGDSAGAAPPQVGFIVTRAVGGAVERNRVRRRLRHLVRDRLTLLPPGARIVIRANPAAAMTSHPALSAQLDRALARALGLPEGTVLVDASAPADVR